MLNKKSVLIIALIAIVNALGYGIIIPVLYSYSQKFGLTDFQNGLLFAIFSVCQFVSTPLIGRLSDKYGRRPLLITSIIGTAASFFMMAFAPSAIFLFLARALDGITAGNMPVALAVISDTMPPKDRPRGFGLIGASFGFGFIFGPAISAFTVGISPALPFVIAGIVTTVAVIITGLFLPETNQHLGETRQGKLFDLGKLFHALTDANVGPTLLITLFHSLAFSMFIYAFQPFSVKILHLSPNQISLIFTIFGVLGLISQMGLLPLVTKKLPIKKSLSTAIFIVAASFVGLYMSHAFIPFIAVSALLALANGLIPPLTIAILSRETSEDSQGTMQGFNSSYMSIGQIFGPILGGAFTAMGIPFPFLAGSFSILVCFFLSFQVLKPGVHKEDTF